MKQVSTAKKGFTIIEVSLVTAFIAMLLIAIALILTNMFSLYQKGMTLKAINSTGRNLVAELTAAINDAPWIDTTSLCNSYLTSNVNNCVDDNAFKYIFQDVEATKIDNVTHQVNYVQYGGVLCTGGYSYVWNTKYGIDANQRITIRYTDNSGTRQTNDFKVARFRDRTYRACSTNVGSNYNGGVQSSRYSDITKYANGGVNKIDDFTDDLLETTNDDSEVNLSLYELTIFPVSQDSVTLRAFFSGTFILGTERGNASIVRSGDYCDLTNTQQDNSQDVGAGSIQDLGSEFNYCGINKFNFAARTAGSGI